MKKEVLVIAGEASGDLHGASMINELLKFDSGISVCGIGGDKMHAEGAELFFHINQMAFLGIAEVVKHIPFIKKVQKNILAEVKKRNIKTAVLIDYPGFNLSIAKKLKQLDVKIIYYISPQIWAWGKGRIKKIQKLVDKMVVILPFEKDFYGSHNVDVEFVGHPLIKQIQNYNYLSKEDFFAKFNLDTAKEILLLLPGSRIQEVKKIFPEIIKAASKISNDHNLQTVVACSSNIDENLLYGLTDQKDFKIIKDHTYDLFKYSKFGIIKSGTSTLEAALFGLPMIVVYVTSKLTYLIGKNLVKIDSIALANIVSGEKIVTELIQNDVNEKNIYKISSEILSDENKLNGIKNKFNNLKDKLSSEDASKKCAEIVLSYLK